MKLAGRASATGAGGVAPGNPAVDAAVACGTVSLNGNGNDGPGPTEAERLLARRGPPQRLSRCHGDPDETVIDNEAVWAEPELDRRDNAIGVRVDFRK